MTPAEIAIQLDGREYRDEVPSHMAKLMKEYGIVAIFGASDDLMEIEGAVSDETGEGKAYFTSAGLLKSECDDEECPYFAKEQEKAQIVTSLWDRGEFAWRYETEIPHVKFVIKEDGENYCEGIVFALADVKAAV